MRYLKKKNRGFTLVEITVVLVIVGLLIGAGFSGLGAFMDNAKQSNTRNDLLLTKQALLNYVRVNKHMPCPDTDTPPDGVENREEAEALGIRCSGYLGTVPYNDIGISREGASDDYNNLFGYAVHKEANELAVMGLNVAINVDAASLLVHPGAYFYNLSPPVFDLDTPPTALFPEPNMQKSYQVCKKYAENNCSGSNDVEVSYIPAVLIAYNENGDNTKLDDCTGAWGAREGENCNTDTDANPIFIRGVFTDGVFDDQIVTISAYEIKEQALGDFKDPPTASDDYDSEYDGYDVIIRGDMDDANDLNVADGVDNAFYIDKNEQRGEEGNLNANVVFKDGNDTLHIEGSVESSGNAKLGSGNDDVYVGQDVQSGAIVNLGDSTVTTDADGNVVIIESAAVAADKDTLYVNGNVDDGAKIYGDDGNDVITLNGDVNGLVDMGKDNDLLLINKGSDNAIVIGSTADINGGTGEDVLYVDMTGAEWNTAWDDVSNPWKSRISNFEYLSLNDEAGLWVYDDASGDFIAP